MGRVLQSFRQMRLLREARGDTPHPLCSSAQTDGCAVSAALMVVFLTSTHACVAASRLGLVRSATGWELVRRLFLLAVIVPCTSIYRAQSVTTALAESCLWTLPLVQVCTFVCEIKGLHHN